MTNKERVVYLANRSKVGVKSLGLWYLKAYEASMKSFQYIEEELSQYNYNLYTEKHKKINEMI